MPSSVHEDKIAVYIKYIKKKILDLVYFFKKYKQDMMFV